MHADLSRGNYLDKVHSEKRDGDDIIIFISFYVENLRALLRIVSSGHFDICGVQATGCDTAALFS
jgi:hypothetical protein